ncbi:hypothetical protein L226DRAFT_558815 [Lentinus tigrinus ALCF2SS1-7]|uniref:uncharacterized protein n=1 Tax=Lentinus tigrinus ALCF2SS1-7 TaxID=1328758 RepID=UPI001165FC9A|nr:hypothetical protein L226DRAFT_558815 [Lentinus tigrinus ALCF2SS1-7]
MSPGDFGDLFSAIGTRPNQERLEHISIDVDFKLGCAESSRLPLPRDLLAEVDPRFSLTHLQPPLTDDVFIPLYNSTRLKTLYIATPFPVLVTDSTVGCMASAWRKIRYLTR